MTGNEYEKYVKERCLEYVTPEYCVIAINEEAGEIAGWWKKAILRGNPKYTQDDLIGEMGDVLFYLVAFAAHYGWSLEDIMKFNKEKLDARSSKKEEK